MTTGGHAWLLDDDHEHTDADAPDAPPSSGPRAEPPPVPRAPSELQARWVSLADCPNRLIDSPPAQKWLLKRSLAGRELGVFPRGKTGLLVGAGGVSKTMCATQWAVAVALGGFFLETFRVTEPGHVVLALAEEELEEAIRRLWRACNALELSADQRKDVAGRVHVLPLHSVAVALLRSPAMHVYEPTEVLADLRAAMESRAVDWSTVILDPLARWSGGGAERDNEAATRFVQIVETLTKIRGNPSELLVHHSSQVAIAAGSSAPRGVTGLHDGFRWVASMDAVKANDGQRGIKLHNGKSNYSPEFDDLLLIRNTEPGIEGTLRLATALEAERFGFSAADREKAKEDKTRGAFEAECRAVLTALPEAPACVTLGELDAALRGCGKAFGDKKLNKILQHLASAAGGQVVVDHSNGAQSKPRQWARKGNT